MEPRPSGKPVESRGGGPPAPPRPSERRRRFQIVKLEERIAPAPGKGHGSHYREHSNGNGCYRYSIE
jgi:hypothetical protein